MFPLSDICAKRTNFGGKDEYTLESRDCCYFTSIRRQGMDCIEANFWKKHLMMVFDDHGAQVFCGPSTGKDGYVIFIQKR